VRDHHDSTASIVEAASPDSSVIPAKRFHHGEADRRMIASASTRIPPTLRRAPACHLRGALRESLQSKLRTLAVACANHCLWPARPAHLYR